MRRKHRRSFRFARSKKVETAAQRNKLSMSGFELLENRSLLAANLFVDWGDNFPRGTLTTTQGAFRDVADDPVDGNRILGTTLVDSANNFNAGTQLDIVRQTFSATSRERMMAVVRRAYEALDVNVVELTGTPVTTADGRSVSGAANMTDVVNTLRGGNAGWKDAYIFVATFIVDPGGAAQQIYGPGGGGLSPDSPVLGAQSDLVSASNLHDDVAVVYSGGGFSLNTTNNISHEAGHLLGLQHAITNDAATASINLFHRAEIMSYQNTNDTSSSTFTRYPMIRGDNNSPGGDPVNYNDLAARMGQVTIYDQLRLDGNVLASPAWNFVSGTGAHDIITITRNGANADITIQAFADSAYSSAITVPGEADGIFSYSIPLTSTILLHAGGSDDRIVIDADLGVNVIIDGMLGTDSLVVMGKNLANGTYQPRGSVDNSVDLSGGIPVSDFGGSLSVGANSIQFRNFETTGSVLLQDFVSVEYVTPGSAVDDLLLESTGNPRVGGTVNSGVAVVPVSFSGVPRLDIRLGAAEDTLTNRLGSGGAFANGVFLDAGSGGDRLIDSSNTGNLFQITGANSGLLDGFLSFSSVASLVGGSMEDEFRFTGAGTLAGGVTGLGGVNKLNYAALASQEIVLANAVAGGFHGMIQGSIGSGTTFMDIAIIRGSNVGNMDRLIGIDAPATWNVNNGVATYTAGGSLLTVHQFEDFAGNNQQDVYDIRATDRTMNFIGAGGNDRFVISSNAPLLDGNLNDILGAVNIDGGSGDNQLIVANDSGVPTNTTITQNTITGMAPAAINFTASGRFFVPGSLRGIWLRGSQAGDDLFYVYALLASNTLEINGNNGADNIITGPLAQGNMRLDGQSGRDIIDVHFIDGPREVNARDSFDVFGDHLTLRGLPEADSIVLRETSVERNSVDRVRFNLFAPSMWITSGDGNDVFNISVASQNVMHLRIEAGAGDDYARVLDTSGLQHLIFEGNQGSDRLRVDQLAIATRLVGNMHDGADQVFLGSNAVDNNGRLDQSQGLLLLNGGDNMTGEDRLYINDHGTAAGQRYRVNDNSVQSLSPRDFSGLSHEQFELVRLEGTDFADEFQVAPSVLNRFVVDGNLPAHGGIACAAEGDFLNLVADAASGRRLTITNRANGAGNWTFTNGFQGVHFREIERFNHVSRLAIGSDAFREGLVRVLDAESGDPLFVFQPYESSFTGGVRVATGDVTGDGIPDVIVAPGPGRAPEVRIYDGLAGTFLGSVLAYSPTMRDGLLVAAGDTRGSCAVDIVTTTGPGAGRGEVRVWQNSGSGFFLADQFLPFGPYFFSGASVAVGDFNGDGTGDIAVGALHGQAHVAVFDGRVSGGRSELSRFMAFGSGFFGGVHVAAGNVMGNGAADLIVSTGFNSWGNQYSSRVHVYNGSLLRKTPGVFAAPHFAFQAFQQNPRASVRTVAMDFDLDGVVDRLFAAQGPDGNVGQIRIFQPLNPAAIDTLFESDVRFLRGIFVG